MGGEQGRLGALGGGGRKAEGGRVICRSSKGQEV